MTTTTMMKTLLILLLGLLTHVNCFSGLSILAPPTCPLHKIPSFGMAARRTCILASSPTNNLPVDPSFTPIGLPSLEVGDDLLGKDERLEPSLDLFVATAPAASWRFGRNVDELVNVGLLMLAGSVLLWQLTTIDAGVSRGWTTMEIAARLPHDVWGAYMKTLNTHPVWTKAVTSGIVYTIGDIISQRTEGAHSMGDVDRARVARSMAAGFIGHGPLSHCWYNFCDGFFNDVLMWTAWWAFLPKVLVDQMFWGPIWNNTYIILLGIMKFDPPKVILKDMKRTTIPLVLAGLKLWPLAHCVTYGLIPVENRLLWVDMVEILWVTILASQAAGHVPIPDSDDSKVEVAA